MNGLGVVPGLISTIIFAIAAPIRHSANLNYVPARATPCNGHGLRDNISLLCSPADTGGK